MKGIVMRENPAAQYEKRKEDYHQLVKKQDKEVNLISNLRFITFFLGLGIIIYFHLIERYLLSAIVVAGFILLFLVLVFKHQQAMDDKDYLSVLLKINEDSLERLKGQWHTFPDTGEEFLDENHHYAQDLDIFGQGSLFQWINTAATFTGREKLRKVLSEPCQNVGEIKKRQEAVEELARKLNWRQEFTAEGLLAKNELHDPGALLTWAGAGNKLFLSRWKIILVRLLPVATILLILIAFISSEISYFLPVAAVGMQILLLVLGARERGKLFDIANTYKNNLRAYSRMIKLWEKERFKSTYLKELQGRLINQDKQTASVQLHQLEKIVGAISHRHHQLYLIINILLLWDYQCLIALEGWKEKSGDSLGKWIEAIGEVEVLASLAVIRYDHPDWAMPTISGEPLVLAAEGMGHPLLTGDGISNDMRFVPPVRILLITGSNMSGKSTLLRTAGINLVLAYAGAPVCARKFTCSLMDIYTCMRVSDNLEKNISSFYAELLRIRMIVRAAEEGREIFFLLDEIFKGTNSTDRHTGAKVLINKLSEQKVLGLVSTHDLELGALEEENNKIKNFHFREYYEGDQLHFDYQLRPGLSTTRNAIYLMKMAGIEVEKKEKGMKKR
jgi:DNA mismatch repair ATPase MutS